MKKRLKDYSLFLAFHLVILALIFLFTLGISLDRTRVKRLDDYVTPNSVWVCDELDLSFTVEYDKEFDKLRYVNDFDFNISDYGTIDFKYNNKYYKGDARYGRNVFVICNIENFKYQKIIFYKQ